MCWCHKKKPDWISLVFFPLRFWLSAHNNYFCKLRPSIVRMQHLFTSTGWTVTTTMRVWYPLMGGTSHFQLDMGHPAAGLVYTHYEQDIHPLLFLICPTSMMEIQNYSTPRTVLYEDSKLSFYFWQEQRLNLDPQTCEASVLPWSYSPSLWHCFNCLTKATKCKYFHKLYYFLNYF